MSFLSRHAITVTLPLFDKMTGSRTPSSPCSSSARAPRVNQPYLPLGRRRGDADHRHRRLARRAPRAPRRRVRRALRSDAHPVTSMPNQNCVVHAACISTNRQSELIGSIQHFKVTTHVDTYAHQQTAPSGLAQQLLELSAM